MISNFWKVLLQRLIPQKKKTGGFTKLGKKLKADIMYEKGCEFIGASMLLKNKKGRTAVQMYLLLQGLEILLKGILLSKNYDKYQIVLKKKYGHNIPKLFNEVKRIYKIKIVSNDFNSTLLAVSKHYRENNLRYGSLLDIFIDINTIKFDIIEKKTYQLLLFINRNKVV
jgi:hypothetical protein